MYTKSESAMNMKFVTWGRYRVFYGWILFMTLWSGVQEAQAQDWRWACKSKVYCGYIYSNLAPIQGRPEGSVCLRLSGCGSSEVRVDYYYREEGEACYEVYAPSKKIDLTCGEFLAKVNGKKANRFFKSWKKDDDQPYRPMASESSDVGVSEASESVTHVHEHCHSSHSHGHEHCHSHSHSH